VTTTAPLFCSEAVADLIFFIGSGVFCQKSFVKGQFLIEYRGDLVENGVEENQFDDETFVYFFKHKKYAWYSFLICEFFY